jgi:hypothetical protein
MVATPAPVGLSAASRILTVLVAVGSGVLGALLFVAPGWAAPRFAWSVTELMVMSIGAWFLGNCVWAARIARGWSWAHWSSGLYYLWGFGVLQSVVLVVYRAKVHTASPVAWLYLALIGLMVVTALVGVVDVVRLRPATVEPGPPVPRWLRVLVVAFVAFVTFLFAVAMVRPSAAVGGSIYPEDMSPFTVRSFGVYFLTLVLGVLVVARRRTLGPLIGHIEGGLGITAPILLAALLHLRLFDLAAHPGQWIYLGSYTVVLVIGVPTVVFYRRAQRLGPPAAPAAARRRQGIPAPRSGSAEDESIREA